MTGALRLLSLTGALVAVAASAPAKADQYKYVNISVPGAVETRALYVNEAHKVTGTYTLPNGRVRLFTWEGGAFKTFLPPKPYEKRTIRPTAIGPTGMVVGVYGDKKVFPFLLESGASAVTPIAYPGDGQYDVTPTSISPDDAETVAGYEGYDDGGVYGFIAYPKTNPGNWSEYNFGGATSFKITALANIKNSNEGYAGTYVLRGKQHGFRGQSSKPIDPPGSLKTELTYLNNNGDLGGHAFDKAGQTFGFVRRGHTFTNYRFPKSVYTMVTRNLGKKVFGQYKKDGKMRGFYFLEGKYYRVQSSFGEVTLTGVARDGSFAGSVLTAEGKYRGYVAICEAASGDCEVGGPAAQSEDELAQR